MSVINNLLQTCLKVSLNLGPPEFGRVRVGDVEVPSSEQFVAKVDGFALPHFNVTLIVSLTHPVCMIMMYGWQHAPMELIQYT